MKIKVCGIANNEFIENINSIKIDFIGFIFYTQSKRYIMSGMFSDLIKSIPGRIKKVGVFVNDSIENISKITEIYKLDFIQLHGDESLEFVEKVSKKHQIIKAFRVDEEFSFASAKPFEEYSKYFLFDTKSKHYGGTGEKFNWDILHNYHGKVPFLLSGGITPNDINKIRNFRHPQFIGIDINSGFEIKPGIKDINLIKSFINEIVTIYSITKGNHRFHR